MEIFKKVKSVDWYTNPTTVGHVDAIHNIELFEKTFDKESDYSLITSLIPTNRLDWPWYTLTLSGSYISVLKRVIRLSKKTYTDDKELLKTILKFIPHQKYIMHSIKTILFKSFSIVQETGRVDISNILIEASNILKTDSGEFTCNQEVLND